MTKGTSRTRKFKLQNTSLQTMSFSVDKKVLTSAALTMEPEAVNKLPGGPEFASCSLSFTLNTALPKVQPGPILNIIPVEIKAGPTVLITVKALVVVPELRASRDVLDFGSVQAGLTKLATVQLHNPKEVPVEWSVRKPTEGVQDWSFFNCSPDSGVIAPGERLNIRVMFTPIKGREKPYMQRIPIRLANNSRQIFLNCSGTGYTLKAVASTPVLDLGPIIPKFAAQEPRRAQFELSNPCSQPIEVFSVDLDQRFREEEELLRKATGYGANNMMMMPVREPGAPLWELASAEPAAEAAPAADAAPAEGEGVGELQAAPKPDPLYFVVLGDDTVLPEKAGFVKLLEDRYSPLPQLTVDSLVHLAKIRSPQPEFPETVRALLSSEATTWNEDQLLEVLQSVLTPEYLERGAIFTSLKCAYCPRDVSLKAVLRALGLVNKDGAAPAAAGKADPKAKGGKPGEPAKVDEPVPESTSWEGERKVYAVHLLLERDEFLHRKGHHVAFHKPEAATQAADAQTEEPQVPPELMEAFEAYDLLCRKLNGLVTPKPGASSAVMARVTTVAAGSTPSGLLDIVVGNSWNMDVLTTVLPPSVRDKDKIPPEYLLQPVYRPDPRTTRNSPKHFKLYTVTGEEPTEAPMSPSRASAPTAPAGKGKEDPKAKGAKPGAPGGDEWRPPAWLREETRWIIPPGGSVKLEAHFQSEEIGKFAESFLFETMGGGPDSHPLVICQGVCAHPQISRDFRNVFYKKVKQRPAPALVSRQFIISEDVFDFGPLLFNPKKLEKDAHLSGNFPDNTAKLRITNSGLFDLHVDLRLKSTGKGQGAVFIVHPEALDLKIDETQEVSVFAFPAADGKIEDVLECVVKDNPTPVEFKIQATGAKPAVTVEGPDAKGLVLFDRLLTGKKETKTVSVTNTSLLQLAWELEGVDKLPPEVKINPQRGEIAAQTVCPIYVDFEAGEPKAVTAPLKLKIFDVKKSQPAFQDVPVTVQGESYKINVAVTFPDPTKNGLDFGTLRVVEDREKEIGMQNTGKVRITALRPWSGS